MIRKSGRWVGIDRFKKTPVIVQTQGDIGFRVIEPFVAHFGSQMIDQAFPICHQGIGGSSVKRVRQLPLPCLDRKGRHLEFGDMPEAPPQSDVIFVLARSMIDE
ncbi:MAG: hypothetical protein C3F11_08995 [Methylocystaceae bacterium]|nr:MAG: hypothetical protein C3F11_08995 [Methylocystaceae bacterium]